MDCSPPVSSVHGILRARTPEWVAMPSPPGDLPDPGIKHTSLVSPALAGGLLQLSHEGSSSEYIKREADTDVENKQVVTSGEGQRGQSGRCKLLDI